MVLSGYILGIVGVVILGVVIDLMLVEGQMQKYIKSIFVVFVIFTIVSPIPKLMQMDFVLPVSQSGTIELDADLLKKINASRAKTLEQDLLSHLKANGVSGVEINVEIDDNLSEFTAKKISVFIKNLVIENNYLNINKYEVLTRLIVEVTHCSEEIIEFYE